MNRLADCRQRWLSTGGEWKIIEPRDCDILRDFLARLTQGTQSAHSHGIARHEDELWGG